MLEAAQSGGLLRPNGGMLPDDDELAAEDEVDDYVDEAEEDDEDEDLLGAVGPILHQTSAPIGPGTPLRTSSKGEEFLFVASTIERWLGNCPQGPLELGLRGAHALAPLVCCWSATVTHALAPEPLTLAELQRAVQILDGETVAEHLEALERSGQVAALPRGGETRYALTDWGREGIAPIIAAVRFEGRYPEDDVLAPDVFDVEAAYQMALPLLRLPPDLRGSCRLGVRVSEGEPLMAGSAVTVDRGAIVSASPLLEEDPETWATGSALDWCETVIEPAAARIETGGDTHLARALLEALHERLFGELSFR